MEKITVTIKREPLTVDTCINDNKLITKVMDIDRGASTKLHEMNKENILRVARFFSTHEVGTAKEIGVSCSFLRSLTLKHLIEVAGERQGDFYEVGNGLYRRSHCHEYKLNVTPVDLATMYKISAIMAYSEQSTALKDCVYWTSKSLERLIDEISIL